MLTAEEQMEIAVLKKHGKSIRAIAAATGKSRNTVRRYLRGGDDARQRKKAPKRPEKLDPFKDYIVERLAAAAPDTIPAAVLFREVKARGYDGGETRLKVFVRGLRPAPKPDPVVRFETEPGCQMQVDWATIGRGPEQLSVFIATLGWSRMTHVVFCDNEKFETLRACHEQAFEVFGGVPREVLFDNMKTVVLERNAYGRDVHRFHPGLLDYARHAGFLPRLCRPYRAKTKGKVERFIRYLKESFWVPFVATCRQDGLAPDRQAANAAVKIWLREVANARLHATTHEVPAERLIVERAHLQPLPRPYRGKPARPTTAESRLPVAGYQHPLAVYDALLAPMPLISGERL
jgi:transposase